MIVKPYLINFNKIGDSNLGYISVAEKTLLPFIPKRIYWTYFTPENVIRGKHAHFDLEQILIAVSGRIIVTCELKDGTILEFILESPDIGLFIPKMCWRTMKYSHNAVQVCFASHEYDREDYIRDYEDFIGIKNDTSIN